MISLNSIKELLTIKDHRELLRCILSLINPQPNTSIIDVGCNDGAKTEVFAKHIGTKNLVGVWGVDIVDDHLSRALKKGIHVTKCNIEDGLPFRAQVFDIVVSNQVIEHLIDTDVFVEEIHRVLKKGGYAIVATENLSYLGNIVALLMGYQAFSQHISNRFHLGNPFSSFAGVNFTANDRFAIHRRIFTIRGLKALFCQYGFMVDKILGAGFSPFPSWISRLNKIHARFIVIRARKF